MEVVQPKKPLTVTFTCEGRAVGKMRNDLSVAMTEPMVERFAMATDEGSVRAKSLETGRAVS